MELGQFELALADVEQALVASPWASSLPVTHILRANILSQLGRSNEALAAAQQAAELAPAEADIQLALGRHAYRANYYEEGIVALQRSLELDPRQPSAAFVLGLIFLAAGQMDKARDAYRQAVRTCEESDKEIAYISIEEAFSDLDKLRTSRIDLVLTIEEIRQLLKTVQLRFQINKPI